ncbi:MAG: bifunctional serine/threonine-protein kinase/formylglycine-generating enzyme family protein [Planctomycetota bacterium]|nr:bifunctional serine/threonine-protein kinase/formylglycine-generating enzyme family protein [Planctomycetota bacterium]
MAVDFKTFLQRLFDSGILTEQNFNALEQKKIRHQNVESFIQDLIESKLLTKFQAEQIIAGKGESLAFGKYIIQEKLGAGGMGQVYKAYHPEAAKLVAIKVILPQGKFDTESVKRFEREVKASEKLVHPNIIAVLDSGSFKGSLFMVMELIEGKDLFELINEKGKLAIKEAVAYIIQAARALEHAHANGVIHRDVKPANLIADSHGFLKIVDMGLAKIQAGENEDKVSMLTTNTAIMGSADFMSPEQTVSTKNVDTRTDIYSLGASFYFLLTARVMYPQKATFSKLISHRQAPISSLKFMRPDVSQKLDDIYTKMVAKKVGDRYQSMTELILDLEALEKESTTQDLLKQGAALNPFQVNGVNFLDLDDNSIKPKKSAGIFSNRKIALFCAGLLVLVGLLFVILFIPKNTLVKNDINNTNDAQDAFLEPPFDFNQAQEEQQSLAKTLGLAVETTVDLGRGVNLAMILIPQGKFIMGSPLSEPGHKDDELQHQVVFSRPYFVGKYEVTQEQWEAVMGDNPSQTKGAKLPVTNISWNDCQNFISKLNAKTESNYRLPTEAEWEFACRSGAKSAYSVGDKITKNDANYENVKAGVKPVGSYKPNPFGLYDMHGNVWEFCSDWYGAYAAGKSIDPMGVNNGRDHVLRGGSYFVDGLLLRSSTRDLVAPDFHNVVIGLRLAKTN